MTEAGFDILPGDHPIVPVMIGDAARGRPAWPSCCWSAASTSSASRTRSCRRARPASGSSCRPRTPRTDVGRAVDAFVAARGRAGGQPRRTAGIWTIERMIEARRLHILRAVADHRTVTAAAAALYLTPSAVSQQLTALEQETGHRLVERGARGVRLTPAGEILLDPRQRRPRPAGTGRGRAGRVHARARPAR